MMNSFIVDVAKSNEPVKLSTSFGEMHIHIKDICCNQTLGCLPEYEFTAIEAIDCLKYDSTSTDFLKKQLNIPKTNKPHKSIPDIKNVIYNDPATIVFWSDGSKTVVKCGEDDEFDEEKGLAMAISKKALGNQGNYYNTFTKWLPGEEDCEELFKAFAKLLEKRYPIGGEK